MKNTILIKVLMLTVLAIGISGCKSTFTKFEEVAVDKLYIKKQCPTFKHEFEIPGRKYNPDNIAQMGKVIMSLEDLTVALATNKKAREIFNKTVRESNQEVLEKDKSDSDDRVVKKIYLDQDCPDYHFVPEFKARKLTPKFESDTETTYVVIPLDKMIFQMEKHKKLKNIFNESVEELNSKPFFKLL